jgi:hypothetical protein
LNLFLLWNVSFPWSYFGDAPDTNWSPYKFCMILPANCTCSMINC